VRVVMVMRLRGPAAGEDVPMAHLVSEDFWFHACSFGWAAPCKPLVLEKPAV
jgi:hypothetical protein